MRKLLLLTLISSILISCKSSKTSCDAYGSTETLKKEKNII